MNRHLLAFLAIFCLIPLGAARADMSRDCVQEADSDRRVAGCGEVIESGLWRGADLSWAYNNRGMAFEAQNNIRRAIQDYDTAIELDPRNAQAFNNRGNAHARLGELEKALADHDRAIAIDATDPKAFNNRAADHMDMGNHSAALPDLDRALLLDPDYGEAIKNRAVARCKTGDVEGAYPEFLRGLDVGKFEPRWLQRFLREKGHYGGAIDGMFGPGSKSALRNWVRSGCD
jgi:tetratricopeptide (TPR) repeat protein